MTFRRSVPVADGPRLVTLHAWQPVVDHVLSRTAFNACVWAQQPI